MITITIPTLGRASAQPERISGRTASMAQVIGLNLAKKLIQPGIAASGTSAELKKIIGSETASGKETWEQPWGERRYVSDNHNELLVRFEQTPDWGARRMNVRFRLFNDGFGFRYEIPEQPAMKVMKIADELTEFNVAQNGTARLSVQMSERRRMWSQLLVTIKPSSGRSQPSRWYGPACVPTSPPISAAPSSDSTAAPTKASRRTWSIA